MAALEQLDPWKLSIREVVELEEDKYGAIIEKLKTKIKITER